MIVERLADIGRKMGELPPLLSLRLLSDQNVSPSDECAPARLSRGSTSKVGGMKLATLGERWLVSFSSSGVLHKYRRPMGDAYLIHGNIAATNDGEQLLFGAKHGQLPNDGDPPSKWF
jgi:hypothetical protein